MIFDINEQSNEGWNSKIFDNFSTYKSGLSDILYKILSKDIFKKKF